MDNAFMLQNPAKHIGTSGASVPPVTITSAYPFWIIRKLSPMALVPEAHAVTTVLIGPLSPRSMDT